MSQAADQQREVYFELTAIGRTMKVVAIDAATGIEVSTIAPATASDAEAKRVALAKLRARLAREPAR